MKIKRFNINERYAQVENDWSDDDNLYTFEIDLTIRADSKEDAENKMEVISDNPDFEMGAYVLSHKSEGGEFVTESKDETSKLFNEMKKEVSDLRVR